MLTQSLPREMLYVFCEESLIFPYLAVVTKMELGCVRQKMGRDMAKGTSYMRYF